MSETANLKLFKHDEVIEESKIRFNIRKSLNENWDKIDNKDTEQDDKLSTIQTENTKLKEENKRLREDLKGLPSGIVSGESIDLKDSSEMRVLNFEIGGNSRQEKREGYNLIDLDNSNNQYVNKVNNGFKLSKSNNRINRILFNNPLPVGTYTLTLKKVNTTLTMEENAVRFSFKNALSEDISIYDLTNKNKITATINQECSSLYFYISANEVDTAEITFNDVQLVEGIEEKVYEPYGVSPSPDYPSKVECCGDSGNINVEMCNKNLIDMSKVSSKTVNGITFSVNKDGTVIANGTATNNAPFYVFAESEIVERKKLPFKNTNYMLSGCPNGGSGSTYRLAIIYTEGNDNYTFKPDYGNGVVVNYDDRNIGIYCEIRKGYTANNLVFKPMLKLGLTLSDYTPRQSQTYTIPTQQQMRAIGEYKDTFIKKDGKWYERHFVKRLILEGTESKWALYTTGTRRYGLDLSTDLPLKIINKYGIGYSSHFEIKNIISSDLIMFLQVELNHFYVGITDINTKWNSTNDLKSWLSEQNNAGAPVYVDYVLETPIEIECTAEQTEILEKIENEAKTYKNVTHIYSTDEISPNMKVTYFKDIETIIGG